MTRDDDVGAGHAWPLFLSGFGPLRLRADLRRDYTRPASERRTYRAILKAEDWQRTLRQVRAQQRRDRRKRRRGW